MFLNFMKQKKQQTQSRNTNFSDVCLFCVMLSSSSRAKHKSGVSAFVGSSVSIFLLLFCAKRASQHAYLMQVVAQLIFYHTLAFRACFLFVLCPRSVRVCVMVFVEFAVAATVTATNHVITNTNKQQYIFSLRISKASKCWQLTLSLPLLVTLSYCLLLIF